MSEHPPESHDESPDTSFVPSLDARQRAMLAEMGVRVWAPRGDAPARQAPNRCRPIAQPQRHRRRLCATPRSSTARGGAPATAATCGHGRMVAPASRTDWNGPRCKRP